MVAGKPVSTGKFLGGIVSDDRLTAPSRLRPAQDGNGRQLPRGPRSRSRRREARPAARRQGRDEHPDARHRPVRQLPPRPERAAAVRHGHRVWSRATSTSPGPGAGERPALRHAVPDRHRAQRRPVSRPTPTTTASPTPSRRRTRTPPRRPTSRTSRPAPTTTSCSTRTSPVVTVAATRTSRCPRSTRSSTPSTTAWWTTSRTP